MYPVRPGFSQVYFPHYNPQPQAAYSVQPPPSNGSFSYQTQTGPPMPYQAPSSTAMPFYPPPVQGASLQYRPVNNLSSKPECTFMPGVSATGYHQTSPIQQTTYSLTRTVGGPVMVVPSANRPISPISPAFQTVNQSHLTSPCSIPILSQETGKKSPAVTKGFVAAYKDDQNFFTTGKLDESLKSPTAEELFKTKASHYGINIASKSEKVNETAARIYREVEAEKKKKKLENDQKIMDEEKTDTFVNKASKYGISIEKASKTCNILPTNKSGNAKRVAVESKANRLTPNKYENEKSVSVRLTPNVKEVREDINDFGSDISKTDSETIGIECSHILHALESKRNSKYEQMLTKLRRKSFANEDVDDLSTPELQSPRDGDLPEDWGNFENIQSERTDSPYYSEEKFDDSTEVVGMKPDDSSEINNVARKLVQKAMTSALQELRIEAIFQRSKEKKMKQQTLYTWITGHKKEIADHNMSLEMERKRCETPDSEISSRCQTPSSEGSQNFISKTEDSDSSNLNPYIPEFKPSGLKTHANQSKQSTILKADVPEFFPQAFPAFIPKDDAHFNHHIEQDENYPAFDEVYQGHNIPVENQESQTDIPNLIDATTNTKRTKQCDRYVETNTCDLREIIVNTVESMFDQSSEYFVNEDTEELDHGHLDVCVQTDENQNSLKLRLIDAQRQLLKTRCYACIQQLELERKHLKSSKYQIFTVFQQLEDRTSVNEVVESRVSLIDAQIISLQKKLAYYELMLDDGRSFDVVPDFGISLELDDISGSLVMSESKEIQTEVSNQHHTHNSLEHSPQHHQENIQHRRFLNEAVKKILQKVEENSSVPKELVQALLDVKDVCVDMVENYQDCFYILEELADDFKNCRGGYNMPENTSRTNKDSQTSNVKSVLVEKSKSLNVTDSLVENKEEMKENVESPTKSKTKKSKKTKKKQKNSQDKVECQENQEIEPKENILSQTEAHGDKKDALSGCINNEMKSTLDDLCQASAKNNKSEGKCNSDDVVKTEKSSFATSDLSKVNSDIVNSSKNNVIPVPSLTETVGSLEEIEDDDDFILEENKPGAANDSVPSLQHPSSTICEATDSKVNSDDYLEKQHVTPTTVPKSTVQSSGNDFKCSSDVHLSTQEDKNILKSSQELKETEKDNPCAQTTSNVNNNQIGTANSHPQLYEAVLQQLKQVYPQLVGNPTMLNMIAAQQTAVLQMYISKSGGSGTANPMQAFNTGIGTGGSGTANQMQAFNTGIGTSGFTTANPMQGLNTGTGTPNPMQAFKMTSGGLNPMLSFGIQGGAIANQPLGNRMANPAIANQTREAGIANPAMANQTLGTRMVNPLLVNPSSGTGIANKGVGNQPLGTMMANSSLANQAQGTGTANPLIANQTIHTGITKTSTTNVAPTPMLDFMKTNFGMQNPSRNLSMGDVNNSSESTAISNTNCSNANNVASATKNVEPNNKKGGDNFIAESNKISSHSGIAIIAEPSLQKVSKEHGNQNTSSNVKPKIGISQVKDTDTSSSNVFEKFRFTSLESKMDSYLSEEEPQNVKPKDNKSLSASILDNFTLKQQPTQLKPPGFGQQDKFWADGLQSETASSCGSSTTLVPSKSSSYMELAPSRDTPIIPKTSAKLQVESRNNELSSQKPLSVAELGFTFSKTLTSNLPQTNSLSHDDNSTTAEKRTLRKPLLPFPNTKPPSLLSLPVCVPEKLQSEVKTSGAPSNHSGFGNSSTNTSEEIHHSTSTKGHNPQSELPPRFQKKRRSLEYAPLKPTLSAEPSWDNEVDDYAEPFILNNNAKRPLEVKNNTSDMDKLEDIHIPEKANTEVEEENNKEEEEDWCQVTKKKKKETKPVVKKASGRTRRQSAPSGASGKSNNFERLVSMMTEIFTGLTRPQIIEVISDVRTVRGGLSGLTVKEIVEVARKVVIKKYEHKMTNNQRPLQAPDSVKSSVMTDKRKEFLQDIAAGYGARPIQTSNRFEAVETVEGRANQMQAYNMMKAQQAFINSAQTSLDDDDICVICHDDLSIGETKTLDCKHEFHYTCISKWIYERERTCPTCRGHALFVEDFPKLGS